MVRRGVSFGLSPLTWASLIRRVIAFTFALAFVSSLWAAERVAWRADLPVGVQPREANVLRQLARTVDNEALPFRIQPPVQSSGTPPVQALQDTQANAAQLTLVPVSILTPKFPEFAVFDSIFLFKGLASVDRYTASVEGRRLLDSLRKQGLRGLGFVHTGMVQLVARRPLDAATDFKGLKVASTIVSESIARQFRALGASTQKLPGGEAYTALDRGVIDATEAGWTEISRSSSASPFLSVLESNHRYRGYVLVANNTAFEQLDKIEQTRLLAAAENVVNNHNATVKKEENEARRKVLKDVKAVTVVSGKDYDALYGQLKVAGWTTATDQQPALASALSISDPALANKHYGRVAPKEPPPQAISYVVQLAIATSTSHAKASLPTAEPGPSVVYNMDLTPQLPRDKTAPERPVLQAGRLVTLRFDIGPKWTASILPDVSPAPEILQSEEDVPLTAVLACSFCEPLAESLKRLTYRPSKGRSEEIRFQFTPRRQDGKAYVEKLQLSIINDKTGREYDRLVVPVAIDGDAAPTGSVLSSAVAFVPSPSAHSTDWQPDVLLYAMEEMGQNISVSIEPVSQSMKKLLGSLALDAEGKRKTFRSGMEDAQLVHAMTNSAYGAMSAVSMQGHLLEKLSAAGTDAAVSKQSQDTLMLTESEFRNVAAVIAQSGQRLYRHLFSNSKDKDLRELIRRLETAAAAAPKDKPLRMTVITNRLSLPWQYLHPVGPDIDPPRFWGMQFALNVQRVNNNAMTKAAAQRAHQVRKVVFAHYGSSADPSVPLAKKQAAQLLLLPLAESDLLKVDTGADLLAEVSAQRKHIAGIVTFLHASSGSADTVPHLQFNNGDIVTSDSLEDLLNKVSPEEQDTRYLAGGPLVILNACETGPARHLPHVKLENTMFQLGAQGVVVTEVSVWINLGHEVATQLIARLSKGEAVADALTHVRRKLLSEKKNPLGLLYVYYGDPAATLRR